MKEINYLEHKRVELNAIPSDVFIAFLERKLDEHGVTKLVPDAAVLRTHAYDVISRRLTNMALGKLAAEVACDAPLLH